MYNALRFGWVILALGLFSSGAYAELKIGFINSDKILSEYPEFKDATEKMEKEKAKWEQEATNRQKKLLEMKDQLEKQGMLLSAERKREIEAQMQKEYADLNKYVQEGMDPEGEMAKKQYDLVSPIIEKINKILDDIAKAQNYDFIFDAKGGSLVFAKKAYDLTEEVMKKLNIQK